MPAHRHMVGDKQRVTEGCLVEGEHFRENILVDSFIEICKLPCRVKPDASMNHLPSRPYSPQGSLYPYSPQGSLNHQKRFLDKLNSGQRIVAVAIGSSYVHDFAGCFHTSLQALYDLGVAPNPFIYPQQGQKASDVDTSRCSSGRYMEGFM